MKVYNVTTHDGESPIAFATKREAMAHARACRKSTTVTVEQLTLIPLDKAAIVRLINCAGGYVEDSTVITTFVHPDDTTEVR
jgi:hypothetical protein